MRWAKIVAPQFIYVTILSIFHHYQFCFLLWYFNITWGEKDRPLAPSNINQFVDFNCYFVAIKLYAWLIRQ